MSKNDGFGVRERAFPWQTMGKEPSLLTLLCSTCVVLKCSWEFLFQFQLMFIQVRGGTCDDRHRRKMAQFVKRNCIHLPPDFSLKLQLTARKMAPFKTLLLWLLDTQTLINQFQWTRQENVNLRNLRYILISNLMSKWYNFASKCHKGQKNRESLFTI